VYHCACCLISTDRNTTEVATKHINCSKFMGNCVHNCASHKRNSFFLDFAKARKHLCVTMTPLGHTVTVSTKQHRARQALKWNLLTKGVKRQSTSFEQYFRVLHCYQSPGCPEDLGVMLGAEHTSMCARVLIHWQGSLSQVAGGMPIMNSAMRPS